MNDPIYIGADHNGFILKNAVFNRMRAAGYNVVDCGDHHLDKDDDFPVYAKAVVDAMIDNQFRGKGVLFCGSGQGMAMAANRFNGIRASVVWDEEEARITRNDNDSNVLCLSARVLDNDENKAMNLIKVWLDSPFANAPRYVRRNNQLDNLA